MSHGPSEIILNMLICCSRNMYYYQCWKKVCCLIFLWKHFIIIIIIILGFSFIFKWHLVPQNKPNSLMHHKKAFILGIHVSLVIFLKLLHYNNCWTTDMLLNICICGIATFTLLLCTKYSTVHIIWVLSQERFSHREIRLFFSPKQDALHLIIDNVLICLLIVI